MSRLISNAKGSEVLTTFPTNLKRCLPTIVGSYAKHLDTYHAVSQLVRASTLHLHPPELGQIWVVGIGIHGRRRAIVPMAMGIRPYVSLHGANTHTTRQRLDARL